jgi:hypothetical protein
MNHRPLKGLLLSVIFSMVIPSLRAVGPYTSVRIDREARVAMSQSGSALPSLKSTGPGADQKAPSSSQARNIYKLILDNKNWFAWEAPAGFKVPPELCKILEICGAKRSLPAKFWTAQATDEKGQKPGMGIVVTSTKGDLQHPDIVILSHTSEDGWTAFLVSVDGNLVKTAYKKRKEDPWEPVSEFMAEPLFNWDKEWWIQWFKEHHMGKN